MRTIDVVVADVQIGKRLRRLNPEKVTALCESITEIGLRSPISVTEECLLIAGLHRLEAFKRLGMEKIPGVVFADEALDAELAQIDENLIRAELTVLERGEHLARRKEIYEARHPETKQGAQGGGREGKGTRKRTESEINSFSEDAATKTNQSRRTVEQEVQISRDLSDEVKEQIRDTPTANSKTDLLKLSRLDPKTQRQVAGRLTSGKLKIGSRCWKVDVAGPLRDGTFSKSIQKPATDLHLLSSISGAGVEVAAIVKGEDFQQKIMPENVRSPLRFVVWLNSLQAGIDYGHICKVANIG